MKSNSDFGNLWLELTNQEGFKTHKGKWRDAKPHPNMRDQSVRAATKAGARFIDYWWPHGIIYRDARDRIMLSYGTHLEQRGPLSTFEEGMREYQKLLTTPKKETEEKSDDEN